MVSLEIIIPLINERVKKILDLAKLSLPDEKFVTFRRMVLDEFGRSGLIRELERVGKQLGKERLGPEYTEQRRGAP